jgi:transcriptional regulator with XRE-family HTH domain
MATAASQRAARQRVCASCRTMVLSRYNPDVLCAACIKAARTPQQDAGASTDDHHWIWESPLLCDALVRADLGAVMALFRAAAGLSQQQLAQILGCSQTAVWRIEAGERRSLHDIRELLRFADTIGMPRTALLPLILGRKTNPHPQRTDEPTVTGELQPPDFSTAAPASGEGLQLASRAVDDNVEVHAAVSIGSWSREWRRPGRRGRPPRSRSGLCCCSICAFRMRRRESGRCLGRHSR